MAEKTKPNLRLRVTATAETILRKGHPWLFAQSVRSENRPGETGEMAVIYDRADKFLAAGLYDADSPLRVRILHHGKPMPLNDRWWQEHAAAAIARRRDLFDAHTTGFRLISGENDGWSGLVLDQYATTRVLKLYTAAWLPRLPEISQLLRGEGRLILRLSRNIQELARRQFQLNDGYILHGQSVTEPVIFLENGIRFEADVLRGQKTGFFLDQRENRSNVEALAQGRSVLNLFSFSGGFSLYAARGGATSVTSVDISEHALAAAKRNFALNQENPAIARCRHETVQADVFLWLKQNSETRYDLIVIDPPSLAKREVEKVDAMAAYSKLIEAGLKRLGQHGILVAASCSAHVGAEDFFGLARDAARKSGRKYHELRTTQHPPDHPATFAEGAYLKCIYFSFQQ